MYTSQYLETSLTDLVVVGDIPKHLAGDFISIGPAQFEIGSQSLQHWFDGFAMLKKFSFDYGTVSFKSRFLQSKQYKNSTQSGHLYTNEFATYAHASTFGRIWNGMTSQLRHIRYDNCNVNISRIANSYVALTESQEIIEFDANTLDTFGSFQFVDNIKAEITTAHPHVDFSSGVSINVSIEVGPYVKYHVYQINLASKTRQIIKTYQSKSLFYIHSFSVTRDYVILFKSPLAVSKLKLICGLPFLKTMHCSSEQVSYFVVIDRQSGAIIEIETDPFVCLHSANAYQQANEIILDLVCYSTLNPYESFYLANLRQAEYPSLAPALRRYILNLSNKQCRYSQIANNSMEFPRIHYRQCNSKPYQYLYSLAATGDRSTALNAVQKVDVQSGNSQYWQQPDCFPGEAIFVANSPCVAEDDGNLLFIAFNAVKQCSMLIILDARTLQQLAEISLPFHLPMGLHGNYYTRAGMAQV